jgi:hypothetical protein
MQPNNCSVVGIESTTHKAVMPFGRWGVQTPEDRLRFILIPKAYAFASVSAAGKEKIDKVDFRREIESSSVARRLGRKPGVGGI